MSFTLNTAAKPKPTLADRLRALLLGSGLARCHCCDTPLPAAARTTPSHDWVCNSCLKHHLLKSTHRCQQCGLKLGPRPTAFGWTRCRHCRVNPCDNTLTTALGDYSPPLSQWVLELKYHNQPAKAKLLSTLLAEHLRRTETPLPDVLVPVPISTQRLKKRGYNQAELIARHLGKILHRPIHTDWLLRTQDTPSQTAASIEQRQKNLESAFECRVALLSSITIGLVDDVITTGSTTRACIQAIRKAGGAIVHNLAICRTPE